MDTLYKKMILKIAKTKNCEAIKNRNSKYYKTEKKKFNKLLHLITSICLEISGHRRKGGGVKDYEKVKL